MNGRYMINRAAKGRRKSENIESRLLSALAAAAATLLLLCVVVRIVFPDTAEAMRRRTCEIIGFEPDCKSAFIVLGEAITGERPFGDAVSEAFRYVSGHGAAEYVSAQRETDSYIQMENDKTDLERVSLP